MIINGILGALVGVTAGCAVVTPVEAVPIGESKIYLILLVHEILYACPLLILI